MIALWVSWFFLLFAFILAYKLLMDRDAWKVHFVEMSAIAEPLPTPWHKSKVMLTVIQGLLACSAFSLLMHFVLPHSIDGQDIQPLPPLPEIVPVNHTNHTNLISVNDSKQCTEGYILDWPHTAFNADTSSDCQIIPLVRGVTLCCAVSNPCPAGRWHVYRWVLSGGGGGEHAKPGSGGVHYDHCWFL